MNREIKDRVAELGISAALIACLAAPAGRAQTPPIASGCTQSASMEFGLNSSTPVAVVQLAINVSATTPTLVIDNQGPAFCVGKRRTPRTGWAWHLDVPPGSNAQLANTSTLNVSFTPDKPGPYTVHLNGCGKSTCTVKLVTDFVNGKPSLEDVDISNPDHHMGFDVVETAQVPPGIRPPPGPTPAGQSSTDPQHFDSARSFCGNKVLLGLGQNPEWFTTTTWETPAPKLELVEGRVYDSIVSRIDTPFGHYDNDADVKAEVDPWLRRLLMDDHASDKGSFGLPFGGIEIEWEWPQWLEGFRPLTGDRISALGYHVIDCGHEINTEIHPPIAVAVHRPLPVLLPSSVSLEKGKPPVPIGSNIYVPGIITDILVNLNAGEALDCAGDSLRQSKLVNVTIAGHQVQASPCVPQADRTGVPFTFNVYLPVNPQRIVNSLTHSNPPVPALFTQFVDPPEVPAGRRTDIGFSITDTSHLDTDTPYITVSVDISQMRTGQTFAKRLISAWVYPDITGKNYGLIALRLRLDQLEVTDSGDLITSGDWRFWLGYSNSVRPWTRLINCDDCIDQRTYSPSDPFSKQEHSDPAVC
jgi:hypothetical protein